MGVNYEIIDGVKYKKCKENQERHPKTMRCRNKLIAKPGYEIIKNKLYKKCKEKQKIYECCTDLIYINIKC